MILIRRVVGDSMQPKLKPGQIVIGFKKKRLRINDVVIANFKKRQIIKRIDKLNKGEVFLVGDNLSRSTDSRAYGWLPKSCIEGVLVW